MNPTADIPHLYLLYLPSQTRGHAILNRDISMPRLHISPPNVNMNATENTQLLSSNDCCNTFLFFAAGSLPTSFILSFNNRII